MINDVSVTAWAPYCAVSLFVQPRNKVPFCWNGLSWDNLCQELYVHQSRAAETDDCQLLRHGERDMSFVQIILRVVYVPTIATFPVQWLCGASFPVEQRACSSISSPSPLSALVRGPVYTFLLTSMNKIISSPTACHALSWMSTWVLNTSWGFLKFPFFRKYRSCCAATVPLPFMSPFWPINWWLDKWQGWYAKTICVQCSPVPTWIQDHQSSPV